MAELEYKFVSKGLDDLRSGMEALAEDTVAVGDAAEASGSQIESSMSAAAESVGKLNSKLATAEEKLSSLQGKQVDVTLNKTASGGSSGGSSDGGGGGGSTFFQGVTAAAQVGNLVGTVADLQEKASAIGDIKDGLDVMSAAAEEVANEFNDVTKETLTIQDALEKAEVVAGAAADEMDRIGVEMDDARESIEDAVNETEEGADAASRWGDQLDGAASIQATSFDHFGGGVEMSDQPQEFGAEDLPDMSGVAIGESALDDFPEIRKFARGLGDAADEAKDLSGTVGGAAEEITDLSSRINGAIDSLVDFGGELTDEEGNLLSMSAAAKKLGQSFTGAKAAAAAVATKVAAVVAAGAGIVWLANKTANWAAGLAESAQKLKVIEAQSGVSATETQELFKVAQRLDSEVDLDTIRDAFKELSLRTTEAMEGTGEAREAFDRLDISMAELEGASTAEVFDRVRDAAAGLNKQQRILTLEQLAGGEAGERLARVFGLTREEYNRMIDDMENSDERQIAALDRLRTRYTALQQQITGLKKEQAEAFGPPAVETMHQLMDVVEPFSEALAIMARRWRTNAAAALYYFGVLSAAEAGDFAGVRKNPGGSNSEGGGMTGGNGSSKSPSEQFGQTMNSQAKEIARIRERAEEGLISEKEMLQQIESVRTSTYKQLQELAQDFPGLFTDAFMGHVVSELKKARTQLEEASRSFSLSSVSGVSRTDKVETTPTTTKEDVFGMSSSVPSLAQGTGPGQLLGQFKSAAGAADSVGDINSLIQAAREQFDLLNNDEAVAFIGRLQRMKAELKESSSIAKGMAKQSLDQFASGIGDALGGALFGDQKKKNRLKGRRRSIQQNLRQARNAGNFGQVRQLSKELDKVNSKLDKTKSIFGRMGEAMKSFGNVAKQVLTQLISKLIRAAVVALILSAVTGGSSASISGMSGMSSFGGFFKGALGGGIPGLAEGGVVTGPTLAMVGEGREDEAVMPLSKLESMIQPATPSTAPAPQAQSAGMTTNVNLAAEARVEGSDLVIGVRKALNEEAAIGGPGTL